MTCSFRPEPSDHFHACDVPGAVSMMTQYISSSGKVKSLREFCRIFQPKSQTCSLSSQFFIRLFATCKKAQAAIPANVATGCQAGCWGGRQTLNGNAGGGVQCRKMNTSAHMKREMPNPCGSGLFKLAIQHHKGPLAERIA
jgi:hypothetical protein